MTAAARAWAIARTQAGLTEAEAARRSGVSERAIRDYEAGRRAPNRVWLRWLICTYTRAQSARRGA